MKFLPYILKHLRKNWIRTLSTVLAMALCIFLICTLQTLLAAFYGGLERASTDGSSTRNRVSLVFNLPLAYRPRHRGDAGRQARREVELVRRRADGGGEPDMKNFFPNFAVDAEPYLAMFPEYSRDRRSEQRGVHGRSARRIIGARPGARSSAGRSGPRSSWRASSRRTASAGRSSSRCAPSTTSTEEVPEPQRAA